MEAFKCIGPYLYFQPIFVISSSYLKNIISTTTMPGHPSASLLTVVLLRAVSIAGAVFQNVVAVLEQRTDTKPSKRS